jgi:hypothetical protein
LGDYTDTWFGQFFSDGALRSEFQMIRRTLVFIGFIAAAAAITGYVFLDMKVFG